MYELEHYEIEVLTDYVSEQSSSCALAAFLAGFACALLTNLIFSDQLSELAKLACYFVAPLALLLAIYYSYRGYTAATARRAIISSCRQLPTSARPVLHLS